MREKEKWKEEEDPEVKRMEEELKRLIEEMKKEEYDKNYLIILSFTLLLSSNRGVSCHFLV